MKFHKPFLLRRQKAVKSNRQSSDYKGEESQSDLLAKYVHTYKELGSIQILLK